MAFSWHKLIPTGKACPDPIVCTRDVWQTGSICIDPCPENGTPNNPGGAGPQICQLTCQNGVSIQGTGCPDFSLMSQSSVDVTPGCPREIRISGGILPCDAENLRTNVATDFTNNGLLSDPADPGTWNAQFGFYYRTPNSPSATPSRFEFSPICMRFNTLEIHDRLMLISGRNRYRYAGWGVDPTYNSTSGLTGIPKFWHNTIAGQTGLSQAECAISGRSWPLPNSVLNLPLWGANTSENPAGAVSDACGNVLPCTDPAICFGCRSNSSVGHFLTGPDASVSNGKYYLSFQCFNPQSFYKDNGGDGQLWPNGRLHQVPTCSLWSLVRAIYDRELRNWQELNFSTESDFRTSNPIFTRVFNGLIGTDPSLTGVGSGATSGQSIVKVYFDLLKQALSTETGSVFDPPNVFLWDKSSYESASAADKWKHLYVIGNGNVLQDTGCISTALQVGPGVAMGNFAILDEVTHDPVDGSTGNARVIQFFGCNGFRTSNQNKVSQASLSISMVGCIPTDGGKPTNDYCIGCKNSDDSASDCQYGGMRYCPTSETTTY